MTDPSTDQIRDLLAREMSVAPEPHPWTEVEQRARPDDDASIPVRRRTAIWLAVAACTITLVVGLAAVVAYDDGPTMPAVDPDSTPPPTPASTSLPEPTAPDEVVASNEQAELTATRVGVEVCTQLTKKTPHVSVTFSAYCLDSTRFTETGVHLHYPYLPMIANVGGTTPSTATQVIIVGVIDSPDATAVQITFDGQSVVVPTGPINQAIDGRFFLATVEWDVINGITEDIDGFNDYDGFIVRDASP
jgi:hypothetical protein